MRLITFFVAENIDIRRRLLVVYKNVTFDVGSVSRRELRVKSGVIRKVVISDWD